MKHPLWWALGAALVVLLAAAALPLWHLRHGTAPDDGPDVPWAAVPQPDGSVRVMGLQPGHDTLGDVAHRLGDTLQVAVVARAGETGALEALVDPFIAGFVSGRLVLAFGADPEVVRGWRERAPKSDAMEGGVRRFALRPEDRSAADHAPLVGLSFVPDLRLSAADVERRFGPPQRRQGLPDGAVQLFYPRIGLAATVSPTARGVLEFSAPRDFERRQATGSAGASAPVQNGGGLSNLARAPSAPSGPRSSPEAWSSNRGAAAHAAGGA